MINNSYIRLILCVIIFSVSLLYSQTTKDTFHLSDVLPETLKTSIGTYVVSENIVIPRDTTLLIEPGVTVLFKAFVKIIVKGELRSIGSQMNAIHFRGFQQDTTTTLWDGIYFEDLHSKGVISNTIIEHSQYGIYCNSRDTIKIIENLFDNNKFSGIYCVAESHPFIFNNIIKNSEFGIECYDYSSPRIYRNSIQNTQTAAIYSFMQSSPEIHNNVLSSNKGVGIYCVEESNPSIKKNVISNNAIGINCANASPLIEQNSIHNNLNYGIVSYGLSRPNISRNNIFENKQHNIRNDTKYSIDVSDNWWGDNIVRYDDKKEMYGFNFDILKGTFKINNYSKLPFNIQTEQPISISTLKIVSMSDSLNNFVFIGDNIEVEAVGIDGSSTTRDYEGISIWLGNSEYSTDDSTKNVGLLLEETGRNSGIYQGIIKVGTFFSPSERIIQGKYNKYIHISPATNDKLISSILIANKKPVVSHFTIINENQAKISAYNPSIFSWSYYDPDKIPEKQKKFEIEIAEGKEVTSAKVWGPEIFVGADTAVSYIKKKLKEGRNYIARLRAYDGYDWSEWSVLSFTTNGRPAAPKPLYPTDGKTLDWGLWPNFMVRNTTDPEHDTLRYKFELYGDRKMQKLIKTGVGKEIFYSFIWQSSIKLEENNNYWWRACAYDYENGIWCPLQKFSIDFQDDPIQPFDLKNPPDYAQLENDTIIFKWDQTSDPDPSDSITYTLVISTTSEFVEKLEIKNIPTNEYLLPFTLNYNIPYYWKVQAIKDKNNYQWNNVKTREYFNFTKVLN